MAPRKRPPVSLAAVRACQGITFSFELAKLPHLDDDFARCGSDLYHAPASNAASSSTLGLPFVPTTSSAPSRPSQDYTLAVKVHSVTSKKLASRLLGQLSRPLQHPPSKVVKATKPAKPYIRQYSPSASSNSSNSSHDRSAPIRPQPQAARDSPTRSLRPPAPSPPRPPATTFPDGRPSMAWGSSRLDEPSTPPPPAVIPKVVASGILSPPSSTDSSSQSVAPMAFRPIPVTMPSPPPQPYRPKPKISRPPKPPMSIVRPNPALVNHVPAAAALSLVPSLAVQQRACMVCLTKKTGQWRRGPAGPRTLCNACGLEWTRKIRHEAQRLGISNQEAEKSLSVQELEHGILSRHHRPVSSEDDWSN